MSEQIIQGTPEWYAIRVGKVTASRIADVCARTKTGYGASRGNYMAEILTERLTNEPAPSYSSPAMQWGTETEPQARAAYEHRHDCDVVLIGFVEHPKINAAGASPDGMVGEDGLVELKCPNTSTHIDMLLSESIPDKYVKQMQFQMACTERRWCDFVSFDPRLPEAMRLFVKRIERDDKAIAEIEKEVSAFLQEVDSKLLALVQRYGTKAAA